MEKGGWLSSPGGWRRRCDYPVVSLAYPLYASIRAIETKSLVDDQQCLTYWILYSMITLFKLTFAKLIEWIPFWLYAKLIVTCWLVILYFSGAAYVYEHYEHGPDAFQGIIHCVCTDRFTLGNRSTLGFDGVSVNSQEALDVIRVCMVPTPIVILTSAAVFSSAHLTLGVSNA
ncbi:hypothetical protein M8C21_032842 [Ambrosia artemisiifolia]|uniref:HVA22-like protein n=1 Tax=Ambrosia artemisiifolia TaxID=4212 RepID=A0AAD5DAA7_AMBAR|nr:hypothetical protein M8C21_032842 [Ambrosia artemisiifolia]